MRMLGWVLVTVGIFGLGTLVAMAQLPYPYVGPVGVSCAANTVSLTTLVVTGGIVTHC